eukprot:COSAG03_NODE_17856_length_366_cov_2.891386_1_plen_77_part_10
MRDSVSSCSDSENIHQRNSGAAPALTTVLSCVSPTHVSEGAVETHSRMAKSLLRYRPVPHEDFSDLYEKMSGKEQVL